MGTVYFENDLKGCFNYQKIKLLILFEINIFCHRMKKFLIVVNSTFKTFDLMPKSVPTTLNT